MYGKNGYKTKINGKNYTKFFIIFNSFIKYVLTHKKCTPHGVHFDFYLPRVT